jgi:hypothetical protein
MQHLQEHRVSTIVVTAAVIILGFTCLASAEAQSADRVVNESTAVQVTSAAVPSVHRYRAAQLLFDIVSDQAASAANNEFIYGDDIIFFSIFWAAYIPIVLGILSLIGDWLMRVFRKLRASFQFLIPIHFQAELRTASNSGPDRRGGNRYQQGALPSKGRS